MQNKLRITHEPPETLTPDPENLMLHNDRNYKAVKDSIQEFGIRKPVVAHEGNRIVYAGNLTLKVAKDLGYATIPVAWIPADIPKEKARAYGVADNRSAQFGEFDLPALDSFLTELPELTGLDTEVVGFNQEEIAEILGGNEATEIEEDEIPEKVIPFTKPGDIWHLGRHKVICGDCTDRAVVDAVMREEKGLLLLTDPPYGCNAGNIGFTAQRDDIEAITKDNLEGLEMQAFLEAAFRACIPSLADNAAWYLWHPMLTQGYFAAAAAAAADLIIHRQIIWHKSQFIFGRGDYHWQHELCFYGWRRGYQPAFYGKRNQTTVWAIEWGTKRSEVGHPTAKPVELFSIPITNHLKEGQVAFDPFLGSGTQLIACEQLNRICRGIEIEPVYVDLIVQRFINLNPDENPSKITLERNKEQIPYTALSF